MHTFLLQKEKRGAGILETVVYVAIFALVFTVVVYTTVTLVRSFGKARIKREVVLQGEGTLARILQEIRLAHDVDTSTSAFAVHPGILKLNTIKNWNDQTGVTREFLFSSDDIILRETNEPDTALTSEVSITRLVFYHSLASSTSQSIRIELTLEKGTGSFYTEEKFYGTAVLRRSYP